MLLKTCVVFGVLAVLMTTSVGHAVPQAAIPLKNIELPSAGHWSLDLAQGDRASLEIQDGILKLDYEIAVQALHQVGHETHKQGSLGLLLKKPVPLDAGTGRILFESLQSAARDTKDSSPPVRLLPLIGDANGEQLRYVPVAFPLLTKGGTGRWGRSMTPYFYCGEAGGATQDIYEAEGGDRNAWPDGKLCLLGFKVEARQAQFGRKTGTFYISGIQAGGMKLPYEEPYAYADGLLQEAGTSQIAIAVANQYQGLPVRELTRQLTFEAASPKSCKQKVVVPLGPDDNYWVNYQVINASGNVTARKSLRYQVEGNPNSADIKAVDAGSAPPLRHLRLNALGRHANGVYERSEPLKVDVRLFPQGKKTLDIKWEVLPMLYDTVLESGQQSISFGDKDVFKDAPLTFKGQDDRDAYRLRLQVAADGKVLDSTLYTFGRRTDLSKPHRRAGMLMDRDYVKKASYERVTHTVLDRGGIKSEAEALADFCRSLDEISRMTRYVTYMIDVRDLEVLPGVFSFVLLDKIVDAATDRGCTLTIRLGHIDAEGENTWLKYSRQRSFDGLEIAEPYYGGFAVTDKRYIDAWLRAYRALHDRYKEHPGFQGYYLLQPAGEATMEDKPWQGLVAGYEQPSQVAFRKYLQEKLGLTLAALNIRWGTEYKSWEEVEAPTPDFMAGKAPDLRLQWVDFCRFKAFLDTSGWFPLAAKSIREYDPNHVIITYGGTGDPEGISGLVDYMHNGGNHFLQLERQLVGAWEKGKTGWITEPHHPHRWAAYGAENGWVLDWSTFVMTAQAAGGGANLHVYYLSRPATLPEHYGGSHAFDRFEKFKPILDELQTVSLTTPTPQIALLQDPNTLFAKHRTTFAPRLEDLRRWFELVRQDGLAKEEFQAANAAQYKLVLPNILDEVMSQSNIERLGKLVKEQGVTMVMSANTGKYCPERGKDQFVLLKELGIMPPAGAYSLDKRAVQATVEQESPLFEAGSKIDFYSLADLQADLQSDEVRKKFWSFPYRWIPQTDYFGSYSENRTTNGQVLARFDNGGVALSVHTAGKGKVLVFWGTPDVKAEKLKGFMTRAAEWAGVQDAGKGNPLPLMLEGRSKSLGRNYVLIYNDRPGSYVQRFPNCPDGRWYIDETVTDQKMGVYSGEELRTKGLPVNFYEGYSPLKIYRLIDANKADAAWIEKIRPVAGPSTP